MRLTVRWAISQVFMKYAEQTKALRKMFADLASALAESDNLKALKGRPLDTPLGDLASFMKYAEQQKHYERCLPTWPVLWLSRII